MRESISVTTIFQIVILFILLFTAIMCLTINNSNAFGVKDEIVNIIEMNNGDYLSDDNYSLSEEIVESISAASYRTTGICEEGYSGFERNGQPVGNGERASVCIKEVNVTEGIDKYLSDELGSNTVAQGEFVNGSYFQIILFYQLDLPVIRQVYNFQTKGETRIIYLEERSTNASNAPSSGGSGSRNDNSNNNNSSSSNNNGTGGIVGDNSQLPGTGDNTGTNPGEGGAGTGEETPVQDVCRTGLVENNLISNIQGVAMATVPIYTSLADVNTSNTVGTTKLDGTKFTILGNSGNADGSGWWAIMYDGKCGWVDSKYMAINAAKYLPSNFKFNITNAGSSAYYGYDGNGSAWITNLTGKKLYDSSKYNNSFVPLTFTFAQKLYNIGQSNSGRTFLINDAYRPYSVTEYATSSLKNAISRNGAIQSVGMRGWGTGWFLASGVSAHNTGCAIDVTFGDLSSSQKSNMPSAMHELSYRAALYTENGGSLRSEYTNSEAYTLHSIMTSGGLTDLASEWWHYQDNSCRSTIEGASGTSGGRAINFYSMV